MFDYFSFKKMVSGILIKLLHVIGFISIIIYGFYHMFKIDFIQSILILILGNLSWRIMCEGLIVIFNIHDYLSSIDSKTVAGYDPRQPY